MKKLFLFIFWAMPAALFAQTKPNDAVSYDSPMSVQLTLGGQGIGAEFRYGFLPALSGRLGASFIPIELNNVLDFKGLKSDNKLSAKFTNIHLLADYTPFKSNLFRVVGGAAYFIKGNTGLLVTPTGTYNYGDIVIPPDQVGKFNTDIDWKGFAPYLGLGLFKSFPQHRFNINLDLGTYFLPQPAVTVNGTGLLSGNDSQQPVVADNVKDYRFLPMLQLNFNYKIR